MRKIYLLVASAFIGATSFGQINLSYESPATNPFAGNGIPEVSQTAGWGTNVYQIISGDATDGNQSAKLETVTNANFALVGLPATMPGTALQSVTGPIPNNGADIIGSVDFKSNILGGDSCLLIFEVYDTLNAGIDDDVLLYSGSLIITQSASTWQTATFAMQSSGETGTANEFYFGGLSGYRQVTAGTTLWLDNWVISGNTVGLSEMEIQNSFKAYPNPVANVLNIDAAEAIENVSVISLDGKLISVTKGGKVDVSNLTTGVYIYEATTISGAKAINKFVKQ